MAPLYWAESKKVGWDHLLKQFQDSQRSGLSWSIDDTQNAVNVATTDSNHKPLKQKVIESYHSTLVAVAQRKEHIHKQIQIQKQRLNDNPPPKKKILTPEHINKIKCGLSKKTTMEVRKQPIKYDPNDPKYKDIHLPPPSNGNLMYTPTEAVSHVMDCIDKLYPNGNPCKASLSEVAAFKEKMIHEKLIPVAKSRLNELIRMHGGEGKPPAPTEWNTKGRAEIINIEDLAKRVEESPLPQWNIDNTRDVLWEEKRKKQLSKNNNIGYYGNPMSAEEVKEPLACTVSVYHTALMSTPSIAHKVVKPIYVKLKSGPKPKKKNEDMNDEQSVGSGDVADC